MTGVQRFTKRPVTIEAMRLEAGIFPTDDSSSLDPNTRSHALIAGWMMGNNFRDFKVIGERAPFGLAISTLEGEMTAAPGDWIIKGVKGEFYPCKPDIFAETYEPETEGDRHA